MDEDEGDTTQRDPNPNLTNPTDGDGVNDARRRRPRSLNTPTSERSSPCDYEFESDYASPHTPDAPYWSPGDPVYDPRLVTPAAPNPGTLTPAAAFWNQRSPSPA